MLTLEVLYAVLMGVNPEVLVFLDRPWRLLCWDIFKFLGQGTQPIEALKLALKNMRTAEPKSLIRLVKEIQLAGQLSGLSRRQKEVLIALRYAKAASFKHLSKILATDRGNTHRRLEALVRKGYAYKFVSEKDGISYVAVPETFTKTFKAEVNQVLFNKFKRCSGT